MSIPDERFDIVIIAWKKKKKFGLSSRYSIDWRSDLDSYFDIDPAEGTISTNEMLDRETLPWHNISIVATKLSE